MNILNKLGFTRRNESETTMNEKNNQKVATNFHFTDKYERNEDEKRIYNLIILDESGSMSCIQEQALNGVNETIKGIMNAQQENPEDNQMISFVSFNSYHSEPEDNVKIIIDCEKIQNTKEITPDQYNPKGSTPLMDAIGLSVTALQKVVKECDNVLVTVITDGMENSSRIYNAMQIKELTEALSKQNWVFTYIGANQDSERTARYMGFSGSMDFEASGQGSEIMWGRLHSSHRAYYRKVRNEKNTGIKEDYTSDFFSSKESMNRITPRFINSLNPDEIFVFGSNIEGRHGGGAARQALEHFGAIMGQGTGLQGQSYAIPTMGGLNEMKHYIDEFIQFADSHPEMKFLVTRIGCGIAGYTPEEIAPMFAKAYSLPNVYLPEDFWKVLTYKY